jgi:hypothetical protein
VQNRVAISGCVDGVRYRVRRSLLSQFGRGHEISSPQPTITKRRHERKSIHSNISRIRLYVCSTAGFATSVNETQPSRTSGSIRRVSVVSFPRLADKCPASVPAHAYTELHRHRASSTASSPIALASAHRSFSRLLRRRKRA